KNSASRIEVRAEADELNDAYVHDESRRIAEPDRSRNGNGQVQNFDHRIEKQEGHCQNSDHASRPQFSFGSDFQFALSLHMFSPMKPSLRLSLDFSEQSPSPQSSHCGLTATPPPAPPPQPSVPDQCAARRPCPQYHATRTPS